MFFPLYYFSDPAVHALQFLDVINMKDLPQKVNFYRTTLKEVLPYIPRVSLQVFRAKKLKYVLTVLGFLWQKLWWQHVWPSLQPDLKTQDSLAAVLQPILVLVQESTVEEYEGTILPIFR